MDEEPLLQGWFNLASFCFPHGLRYMEEIARDLAVKCTRNGIGNGRATALWYKPWMPSTRLIKLVQGLQQNMANLSKHPHSGWRMDTSHAYACTVVALYYAGSRFLLFSLAERTLGYGLQTNPRCLVLNLHVENINLI